MIVSELKNAHSTVRIHDEYCEPSTEQRIAHLSRIVSSSYKRSQLQNAEAHTAETPLPPAL